MWRSVSICTRPVTATRMIAASTGCGRSRSRPVKKTATSSVTSAATSPESGVRAPAVSFTSDCDIPPLIGKPAAETGRQVRAANRKELLRGIQAVPVLGPEHPADRRRLHRGEDETGHPERQDGVDVRTADERKRGHRQPLRHLAEQRDAPLVEPQHPAATIPPITTKSATGRCFSTVLPAAAGRAPPVRASSDVKLVWPRPPRKCPMRSQKSPP